MSFARYMLSFHRAKVFCKNKNTPNVFSALGEGLQRFPRSPCGWTGARISPCPPLPIPSFNTRRLRHLYFRAAPVLTTIDRAVVNTSPRLTADISKRQTILRRGKVSDFQAMSRWLRQSLCHSDGI